MSARPSEWMRILRAFVHSSHGFAVAWREPAFRTELLLACMLVPLAYLLGHTGVERALLIGSIFLVMIVELLNTAVERTVDRISSDWHELSKRAKDLGSAAVMLSLINAAVIWFCVLMS